MYNKRKNHILSWGNACFESVNKDDVRVDRFIERAIPAISKG